MTAANAYEIGQPPAPSTLDLLSGAVHQSRLLSKEGLNERAFTLAFSRLVYAQIWEDPEIDLEALALAPGHRMVTIASGGCNVLSYLAAAPVEITAVDLNTAHVALVRLKLAAARHLPTYEDFFRLFGNAASRANVAAFDTHLAPHLDASTLAYWNGRDHLGRRRIERFSKGFYRYGLLGRFIGTAHLVSRLLGADPRIMLEAETLDEQRTIYERELKPLFEKPIVRRLLDRRASLFGLGIPPPMHEVVEERLRKLACGTPLNRNYFAWAAFFRGYAADGLGPVPPYLAAPHFATVRKNAPLATVRHASFTDHLASLPAQSTDRYVLLDAQDWMDDAALAALWREIGRTARPGARVIFRTAGRRTILPGRVPEEILERWEYRSEQSADLNERDRSAIYGGFHLYVRKD